MTLIFSRTLTVYSLTGPANIEYVADSGEELYAHAYNSILRWETGVDNISVAYITSIGDKSHCHVFQCLDLDEVSTLAQTMRFKLL